MRIAVIGDALLDLEIIGQYAGDCPEAPIPLFKGPKVNVMAGGAANVANLLVEAHATVDLYCQGPGQKDKGWIGQLIKQVCKANRIVWSNAGWVPLKVRGVQENLVRCRIDGEDPIQNSPFPALCSLLDDLDRYDAVLVSDYKKGVVCPDTEDAIAAIVRGARVCVVDSKRHDYSLWRGATALTPNQNEALSIYGTTDPCEIARMVGCKAVFITRGPDDIYIGFGDESVEVEVPEHIEKPYIPGAGDAFAASVTVALADGKSFVEAGIVAVKHAQAYVRKGRRTGLR